jgi:hypothetical protein
MGDGCTNHGAGFNMKWCDALSWWRWSGWLCFVALCPSHYIANLYTATAVSDSSMAYMPFKKQTGNLLHKTAEQVLHQFPTFLSRKSH